MIFHGGTIETSEYSAESLRGMVDEISALGLRHVGYAIPVEFFGPFVSACVETVEDTKAPEEVIAAGLQVGQFRGVSHEHGAFKLRTNKTFLAFVSIKELWNQGYVYHQDLGFPPIYVLKLTVPQW